MLVPSKTSRQHTTRWHRHSRALNQCTPCINGICLNIHIRTWLMYAPGQLGNPKGALRGHTFKDNKQKFKQILKKLYYKGWFLVDWLICYEQVFYVGRNDFFEPPKEVWIKTILPAQKCMEQREQNVLLYIYYFDFQYFFIRLCFVNTLCSAFYYDR